MKQSVIELLESTAVRFPERTAYFDIGRTYTFQELQKITDRIGTAVAEICGHGRPVAVLMSKGIPMIAAFLGAVKGGACYCPLDTSMPAERMKLILEVLEPAAVIAETGREELVRDLGIRCPVLYFDELISRGENEALLSAVRRKTIDTDPLYILFTSGSTGVPKGVVVPHRVILNNMDWLGEHYGFNETDVLANQAPLYFDISDHDIYCPLKFGCSTGIVPPEYFTFPVKLLGFLKEHSVTAVFWVPFALSVVSSLRGLDAVLPDRLRFIFFAGEVMPVRHLNYWRKHLPHAVYSNMYGPTETYVCTYYDLDREFEDSETLPIGWPCGNVEVLVLSAEGKEITSGMPGTEGELCVKGCTLALGYYRRPELTAQRFTQNPLQRDYPETVYHTGDIVSYNERGELLYHDRMDFQIKRLGYRIELGEIEAAAGAVPGIEECACVYDRDRQRIVLCYSGEEKEKKELKEALKERLPHYMIPDKYLRLEKLPRNSNGKIDRKELKRSLI